MNKITNKYFSIAMFSLSGPRGAVNYRKLVTHYSITVTQNYLHQRIGKTRSLVWERRVGAAHSALRRVAATEGDNLSVDTVKRYEVQRTKSKVSHTVSFSYCLFDRYFCWFLSFSFVKKAKEQLRVAVVLISGPLVLGEPVVGHGESATTWLPQSNLLRFPQVRIYRPSRKEGRAGVWAAWLPPQLELKPGLADSYSRDADYYNEETQYT